MSSKVKEFRDMSEGQLKDKIVELRLELIKQNAQIATGTTPKSSGLVRETKRNIARILTILKSKALGKQSLPDGAQMPKVSDKMEPKVEEKKVEKKAPDKTKPKTSGKRSLPDGAQKSKISDKVKKQEGVEKKV